MYISVKNKCLCNSDCELYPKKYVLFTLLYFTILLTNIVKLHFIVIWKF